MNIEEKKLLMTQIEHKVSMIQTFYKNEDGASDLIASYKESISKGTSVKEAKLLLEDLTVFVKKMNEKGNHWGHIVKSI